MSVYPERECRWFFFLTRRRLFSTDDYFRGGLVTRFRRGFSASLRQMANATSSPPPPSSSRNVAPASRPVHRKQTRKLRRRFIRKHTDLLKNALTNSRPIYTSERSTSTKLSKTFLYLKRTELQLILSRKYLNSNRLVYWKLNSVFENKMLKQNSVSFDSVSSPQ